MPLAWDLGFQDSKRVPLVGSKFFALLVNQMYSRKHLHLLLPLLTFDLLNPNLLHLLHLRLHIVLNSLYCLSFTNNQYCRFKSTCLKLSQFPHPLCHLLSHFLSLFPIWLRLSKAMMAKTIPMLELNVRWCPHRFLFHLSCHFVRFLLLLLFQFRW